MHTTHQYVDVSATHESVEEYLRRGGTITTLAPGDARHMTDTQARLYVDGKTIPVASGQLDVRYTDNGTIPLTVETYDRLQRTALDPDGHHAAEWRDYESDSIAHAICDSADEFRQHVRSSDD